MLSDFPVLSLNERDRRWKLTKQLMEQQGLDCLMVAGLYGMEQLDGYLTNDYIHSMVIFPLKGEPVALTWSASYIIRNFENLKRGGTTWMTDYRVGPTAVHWVATLKEKGFESSTIGVVGLSTHTPGNPEGHIPYNSWAYVLKNLPAARFVECSDSFAEMMAPNSEEERVLIRHAARIGELACQTMLDIVKPGVSEADVYAAIMHTIYANAATAIAPTLILQSGPDNPSWEEPIWTYQAQRPRIIQEGDVVQAELFERYGGKDAQQQMSVALKPVNPTNEELAAIARESYETGIRALKPGIAFEEVVNIMEAPVIKAGCWYLTPLIHTFNPLMAASGRTQVGIEQLPGITSVKGYKGRGSRGANLLLKPGNVFSMQPNVCRGRFRVNIGGTAMLTEKGVEELNTLCNRMCIK